MPLLAAPAAALSWLGRQGTRAVAASLFIGIMLPPLAALLKPIFAYALFALLCLAFLRVDPVEVRKHFTRPKLVAAAAIWMMLGTPLLIGLSLVALGMADRLPGLYIAMILQAAAPPVISAPTLAALMGLDAALSLATLVVCTAVTPLTAPVFAAVFVGAGMTLCRSCSARSCSPCWPAPPSSRGWCVAPRGSHGSTPRWSESTGSA